jgi:hypothetical protein
VTEILKQFAFFELADGIGVLIKRRCKGLAENYFHPAYNRKSLKDDPRAPSRSLPTGSSMGPLLRRQTIYVAASGSCEQRQSQSGTAHVE